MAERLTVLSIGTPILGNAVYHANMAECLSQSPTVRQITRSTSDYWGTWAKILFATVASGRIDPASYRFRAEWVISEVVRRGLKRDLRSVRPDVVHCHTQAHALRLDRLAKTTPLVVSTDATSRLLARLPQYASQSRALSRIAGLEHRLFKSSSIVGGVSHWVTDSIRQDYGISPDRIRLCSPSVDTDFFQQSTTPKSRADDRIRVVFIGNDLERKGGLDLIDAMRGPLAGRCDLRMITGASRPSGVPENVTWLSGLRPRTPQLLEELQHADVFALPTREDCFPQALVEALSCGLPLIGTRVMGVPELVRDGVNGIGIESGDKAALAQALRTLAGSPELRHRFGTESRRIALERFSFAVSRQQWECVFAQAAHRTDRPAEISNP